jgi:4-amino-4-deoxy-L-arabinose transferase-like glycosyltransferase
VTATTAGTDQTPQGAPPNGAPGGSGAPGGPGGTGGGPGGTGENGPTGVLRLFDTQLGGQIGWLIPMAVIGALGAWRMGFRRRPDRWHQSLIFWGAWFLTCAVFFSRALFFHRYYLSMLAPAVAALFGIGAIALWRTYVRSVPAERTAPATSDFLAAGPGGSGPAEWTSLPSSVFVAADPERSRWRGWLLPTALLGAAGVQAYILRTYAGWNTWVTPLVVVPCAVGAVVLIAARLRLRPPARVLAGSAGLGLLALLAAPAIWSGDTVRNNAAASGVFGAGPAVSGNGFGQPGGAPALVQVSDRGGNAQGVSPAPAGEDEPNSSATADSSTQGPPPQFMGMGGGPGGPGGGISKQVEQFLVANQGSAKYLVAVSSAGQAEQLILDTGKPVMAMGGFTGSDPILTVDSFEALVKQGVVRFVQLGGMGGPGTGGQSVSSWVQSSCTPVSAAQIQGASTSSAGGQLYDCSAAAK